ncbi:hypothetical protein Nepgr_005394 [Nepenthes gracilis]|uniref:Uncharacterized protein n=1 Tax=Nepenthes gracilis TaxID=150966 RepID=A0AAD3XGD2_NEPGR|nr:hypothetical protein Nepgr_005394 [Nepenthes gracilis]
MCGAAYGVTAVASLPWMLLLFPMFVVPWGGMKSDATDLLAASVMVCYFFGFGGWMVHVAEALRIVKWLGQCANLALTKLSGL